MTTAELRKARHEGAAITTKSGTPVIYAPRRKGDRKPWLYREGANWYRYTAADCKAVTPNGGGPWSVARLLP
jgi:hypothetical protein